MLDESKDLIIKNFLTLMKECNVDVLKQILIDKGIFSANEITKCFSSDDARHNKRIFFFNLQKKEQKAFHVLIESLKETNQYNIAKLLVPEVTGCQAYCFPPEKVTDDSYLTENVPVHVSIDKERLNVKVVPSTEFLDTLHHNRRVEFYSSRSKKRGRVLIINNYQYINENDHKYRNGAEVDNINLQELFNQMGGWQIHKYNNQTGEQMHNIITRFAQDKENGQYDICFVIIMAHGREELHQTVIYGIDGKHIYPKDIQKRFTNEDCVGFRGKPKIFLFQVCRGLALDHTILHTETDSIQLPTPLTGCQEVQKVIDTHIRTQEDMLIGYATLHGYKAHRDPYRGSWYIELICKNFMKFAYKYPVDRLLQLVDQDLRRRMSEIQTMQTAEHRNKGFKNLYLNPGIYYEESILKQFHT